MGRKNPRNGPLPIAPGTPPDPNPKIILDYPVEDVRDFRGGLNTQDLASEVATGGAGVPESIGNRVNYMRMYSMYRAQFPEVMNLHVGHRGRLELRAGQHNVTPDLGAPVQGLMRFSSPTVTRLLVIAGGKLYAGSETSLPATMTVEYPITYRAPGGGAPHIGPGLNTTGVVSIESAYGIAYLSDGTNPPIKWAAPANTFLAAPTTTPTVANGGGITPPVAALTASVGSTGLLDDSHVANNPYRYYCTYKDLSTGVESNPGPASEAVHLTLQYSNLSSIPYMGAGYSTRIYRVGGTLYTPYFVVEVTSGTVEDTLPDSDLGVSIYVPLSTDQPGLLDDSGEVNNPYVYYVTFVNTALNIESNPSAPTIGIHLTLRQAALTSIPVSLDPGVNARNLYRMGGLIDSPVLVDTISDNTTTTWTDNIPDYAIENNTPMPRLGPGGALTMGVHPPLTPTTVSDGGGIDPPTTAVTVAVGSTGLLDDSLTEDGYVYYCTYQYTGMPSQESNPGPPSAPIHCTLKELNLSAIPQSTFPDMITRIYRVGGTLTTPYLVTSTLLTSITDNQSDATLSGGTPTAMSTNQPGLLDDSQAGGVNPYTYYVTFMNSAQGVESNPSPPSSGIHLTLRQALLADLPISTDPQVDTRKIYRVGGTLDTIRLIGTINDNTTTTYTDNLADVAVGDNLLSFVHDPPPQKGLQHFLFHDNRLWAHDATTVYFSSSGEVEYWPVIVSEIEIDGGSFEVDPDAHDPIVGLGKLGSLLFVFRKDSIYGVFGTDWSNFALRRLVQGGCIAAATIARSLEQIWYVGKDNQVFSWDGSDPPEWQSKRIETELKDILTSDMANAVGAYVDMRYMLIVPIAAGGIKAFEYDMREDAWSDISQLYMSAGAAYVDPGVTEVLLGTTAQYQDPATGDAYLGVISALTPADLGATPLDVAFRTPNFEWEKPSLQKRLKYIRIEGIHVPVSTPVTAVVSSYTPGVPVVSHTYPLSTSSTEGMLLETALHPDLIGTQHYVRIAGKVNSFELHNINLRYQYVGRARG